MNPLIAVAVQILPEILKVVASDKDGAVAQQVVKTVTDVTGTTTAQEAKQKVETDPKVAADLQVKLAQIALDAQRAQIAAAQQQSQDALASDKLAADSTQDARKALAALAALDKPLSWTPSIISYIVIASFFLIVVLLMTGQFQPPSGLDENGKATVIQVVNICIGAITAAFTTVVQFWLGSSLGSKTKDNALVQSATVSNLPNVLPPPPSRKTNGADGGPTKPSDGGQPKSTVDGQPKPTDGGPSKSTDGGLVQPIPDGGKPPTPPPSGADRFPACVALTLKWEGGNDDDPNDPGGRTSRGIIQREWNVWRQSHPGLPSDVWQAPQDQINAIYRQNYWQALSCDQLPAGVDYCVFDYGVNSGNSRSAKVLQQLVGADADGELGPVTLAAVAKADAATLINKICDQRLAFLKGLGTWSHFGNGWTTRVEGVRKQGLAMLGGAVLAPQPSWKDPPWLVKARSYQGFSWSSGSPPDQIKTWLNTIKTTSPNIQGLAQYCDRLASGGYEPWCGIFVASMLALDGKPPAFSGPDDTDRFAWAPAWDSYGTKVDVHNGEIPQPGDIMRFAWHSGGEHVTFYDHPVESDNLYHCCGGNQGQTHIVSIEGMPMSCIVEVRRPPA
jgi:lysozyme family protein